MTLPKKYVYIFIVALGVPLLLVLGYFIYKELSDGGSGDDHLATCKIDPSFKYYSTTIDSRVVTPENLWMQHYVQPIYLGTEEEDGISYVVGGLPDASNDCVKVRFIVSGDIPVTDTSGLFAGYRDTEWNEERIDFETLASTLTPGEQFNVRYLSQGPALDELTEEVCQTFGDGSEYYCTLQRIHQEYLKYEDLELLWVDNIEEYPTIFGTAYDLDLVILGDEDANQ